MDSASSGSIQPASQSRQMYESAIHASPSQTTGWISSLLLVCASSQPQIKFREPHAGQVSGGPVTVAPSGSVIGFPATSESFASASSVGTTGRPLAADVPTSLDGTSKLYGPSPGSEGQSGDNGQVESDGLAGATVFAKPKPSWLRFIFFSAVDGTSSKSQDWGSKKSEVVVTNAAGKERRLRVLSSREEAQAVALRLQADLSELGLDLWCTRYEVPLSFFKV